jgi:hypothetical protein
MRDVKQLFSFSGLQLLDDSKNMFSLWSRAAVDGAEKKLRCIFSFRSSVKISHMQSESVEVSEIHVFIYNLSTIHAAPILIVLRSLQSHKVRLYDNVKNMKRCCSANKVWSTIRVEP